MLTWLFFILCICQIKLNWTEPSLLFSSPQTVAYFAKDYGPLIQEAVNQLMEFLGEELTLNLTVGELLWGYKEPLFELIQPIISIPGFDKGEFGFLIGVSIVWKKITMNLRLSSICDNKEMKFFRTSISNQSFIYFHYYCYYYHCYNYYLLLISLSF